MIKKWTKELKGDLQDRLVKKDLEPSRFDPKLYPIRAVCEKVLQRHPLLVRWGDKIRGRVRDYGDLMFTESEVIVGSMLILMREHGVPQDMGAYVADRLNEKVPRGRPGKTSAERGEACARSS